MPSRHPAAQSETFLLQAGHVGAFHVPEGATVFVTAGRLLLEEPPCWLADRMVMRRRLLCESQSHRVAEPGWLCLSAPAQGGAVRGVVTWPLPVGRRLAFLAFRFLSLCGRRFGRGGAEAGLQRGAVSSPTGA